MQYMKSLRAVRYIINLHSPIVLDIMNIGLLKRGVFMSVDCLRTLLLLRSYTDWFRENPLWGLEYLVFYDKWDHVPPMYDAHGPVFIGMKFVTSLRHTRGDFSGPLRAQTCWPQKAHRSD